ncbi:hypothetical protein HDU98_009408 [Podochytrium sp. JEL0797]|nr:hypothetical protein HDU98_009408 [Podochytrium sp. JEL0797]
MAATVNAVSGAGKQLFIGNLPFVVGWQDLKDLFREVGTIVRADVAMAPNGKSRGFGTVLFSTPEDAANAIASYNNYEWHGRKIEVREDRAVSGSMNAGGAGGFRGAAPVMGEEGSDPSVNVPLPGTAIDVNTVNVRALYVGNLPYSVGWQDLKDLFRNAGNVIRSDIPTDYQGRSKGFGTVTMSSVEEARAAIGMYNGFEWNGRRIEVREDRTFVEGAAPRQNFQPRQNNYQQQQQQQAPVVQQQQQQIPSASPNALAQDFADLSVAEAPVDAAVTNTAGRQLFVGNLPFTLQWQELKDLFRQNGGTVLRADIAIDNQGRSRGYGQVLMSTVEEAEDCIAQLTGTEVNGRVIEVREDKYAGEQGAGGHFQGQQSGGGMQGTQIFVGNLPYSSRWQDLKDLFRPLGLNPIHADVLTENDTGRSKGCGMVRFASREEADKAVANLNGTNVMGRNIIVRLDKFAV